MPTVSRPGIALQSPDCHHTNSPFDAAFRVINQRRDISAAAKLVHAHLVTLHRTNREATQTEIGDAVGMSRHQVWRAVDELVAEGLVQAIRIGLGRPNQYVLLGLSEDDLAGRASERRPSTNLAAGQPHRSRAGTFCPQEKPKNTGISNVARDHESLMTSRYGRVLRQ